MRQKMVIKKKYALIINIPTRQREKKQHHRPEFPITENYIKTGGGYIKNKTRIVPGNQTYAETARNIWKIRIIAGSHIV